MSRIVISVDQTLETGACIQAACLITHAQRALNFDSRLLIDSPRAPRLPKMDADPPVRQQASPLDPAWLAHEAADTTRTAPKALLPLARQTEYAAACRTRNDALLAPGARDHHLSQEISTTTLTIPTAKDGHAIPILRYTRTLTTTTTTTDNDEQSPQCVLIYYHGGGLTVGEPDSEDLSCRRLVLSSTAFANVTLYSVGYRLKPQHPAQTSLDDSIDAFTVLSQKHPAPANLILIGSSSGGQLAALVSQHALSTTAAIHGVLLRCPVTSDSFGGLVPSRFHADHTSARDPSFATTLLQRLDMDGPRDGLARMPLEVEDDEVKGMPRTWVQLCTNDVLYSDGACYVRLLREAGVEVRVDVVEGWPHTFWLKAPHLTRALEAEEATVEGLRWVVGVDE